MNDSNAADERRTIHFGGRVQGVGFRFTTRAIAMRYDVSGFVENLADGRVRLVAEGSAAELDAFIGDVTAEMARYISSCQSESTPASGEFTRFSVRR